jgi:hypothetical protein
MSDVGNGSPSDIPPLAALGVLGLVTITLVALGSRRSLPPGAGAFGSDADSRSIPVALRRPSPSRGPMTAERIRAATPIVASMRSSLAFWTPDRRVENAQQIMDRSPDPEAVFQALLEIPVDEQAELGVRVLGARRRS